MQGTIAQIVTKQFLDGVNWSDLPIDTNFESDSVDMGEGVDRLDGVGALVIAVHSTTGAAESQFLAILQDSDDDVTFADFGASVLVTVSDSGGGFFGVSRIPYELGGIRRYARFKCVISSGFSSQGTAAIEGFPKKRG